MIPFINEPEIERILEAAANAGASSAFGIVLRLPWEVNPIFQRWLDQHFPDRAARVMARVREMRGGKDYDASFGTRMKGEGPWAQLLQQRLAKAKARFGLAGERAELDCNQFRKPLPPSRVGQADLFG
jgi:DNA repair photolyase